MIIVFLLLGIFFLGIWALPGNLGAKRLEGMDGRGETGRVRQKEISRRETRERRVKKEAEKSVVLAEKNWYLLALCRMFCLLPQGI